MIRTVTMLLLISALMGSENAGAGGLYKWVDQNGQVQFSDRPPTGRYEEVRLKPLSVIDGGPTNERTAPAVRLYTTTWCGVCKRAKAWFGRKGIAYTEYDVEKSEVGKSEFRRLNGKGVPIILIGDQRMDGFSEARAEAMLQSAGH